MDIRSTVYVYYNPWPFEIYISGHIIICIILLWVYSKDTHAERTPNSNI